MVAISGDWAYFLGNEDWIFVMFVDQRTAITMFIEGTLKEGARGAKMERVIVKRSQERHYFIDGIDLFEHCGSLCAMLVILWHFIRTTLFLAASPTSSLKNLCWSYLRRRHTNSNSSSLFYMITSAEEMLQTEALKCCDCALMRSSKILCLVARLRKTARFIQEILLPWPRWP